MITGFVKIYSFLQMTIWLIKKQGRGQYCQMMSGKVNVADCFHGVGITKILPEALKECHSERIYIAL